MEQLELLSLPELPALPPLSEEEEWKLEAAMTPRDDTLPPLLVPYPMEPEYYAEWAGQYPPEGGSAEPSSAEPESEEEKQARITARAKANIARWQEYERQTNARHLAQFSVDDEYEEQPEDELEANQLDEAAVSEALLDEPAVAHAPADEPAAAADEAFEADPAEEVALPGGSRLPLASTHKTHHCISAEFGANHDTNCLCATIPPAEKNAREACIEDHGEPDPGPPAFSDPGQHVGWDQRAPLAPAHR